MKKLRFYRALMGTCLACCMAWLAACSESSLLPEPTVDWGDKHFLWKVSDENSSVWLLGSIHVANASFYPLPTVIDSAFTAANELAVEINTSDAYTSSELQWLINRRGMLIEGTLWDVLPTTLWYSLDSLCTAWNLPVSTFESMRPWLVASTISTYAYMRAGLKTEYGIDNVLMGEATKIGKPIISLETAEEQVEALAGSSESDSTGICMLKSVFHELPGVKPMMSNLIKAWKTGDDELLNRLLAEDHVEDYTPSEVLLMEEFEQRLLVNRNIKMADSVASFLRDDRNVFVVVGVAHLAFEAYNVIENLRNRGFIVERY
ncbi:MAG: TraB/GumN family protein [Fibrobacter sp.]|uniref:TraB/GumN family protein n=1 Tax=Fibrobacter sp. TaxID=35828 RepID=UPI0025C3C1E7|nr:TraB/GumN family protein [Fibrobacter sp.]MBQ7081163.1 TraB/GumN family protein [Fibrobacter sp.]